MPEINSYEEQRIKEKGSFDRLWDNWLRKSKKAALKSEAFFSSGTGQQAMD